MNDVRRRVSCRVKIGRAIARRGSSGGVTRRKATPMLLSGFYLCWDSPDRGRGGVRGVAIDGL